MMLPPDPEPQEQEQEQEPDFDGQEGVVGISDSNVDHDLTIDDD